MTKDPMDGAFTTIVALIALFMLTMFIGAGLYEVRPKAAEAEAFLLDNQAQTPCLLVEYKGGEYVSCFIDESLESLREKLK